jgi:hypothetical protein
MSNLGMTLEVVFHSLVQFEARKKWSCVTPSSSSSSLPFTNLALPMHVMHVKNVSQMVPHDHQTKQTKTTKAIYA